jgi:V8-like Glu-specific endopeptidase
MAAIAEANQNTSISSICGKGEEIVSTNCLGDSLVKSQARATVKMFVGGGSCTGWLVKAAGSGRGALMLSTGHCAGSSTATFIFDYVTACGAKSGGSQSRSCKGTLVSAEKTKDEHAIYELEQPCVYADAVTPILLDVGRPSKDEGMYLIGHPNGRPSLLSHQEAHDDGHHCEIRSPSYTNSRGSSRASYYCDTQGGNSGSPVFSARTGYAFAIHSHGGCNGNQASANSGGLLNNTGVVKAFDQFGIPYVNRDTTDIMKYEDFVEQAKCVQYDQFVVLSQKSLAECKTLCVNSLICVGILHSASQSTCSVSYRSMANSRACQGDIKYFRRTKTLTETLSTDSVVTTTTTPKPLIPASGFCGFESSVHPFCGIWQQSGQDDIDWTRSSGATPSAGTGPSKAHEGSFYVYTEVSSPVSNNDYAILEALTPTLAKGAYLSFFYHMSGASTMGALKVNARSTQTGIT